MNVSVVVFLREFLCLQITCLFGYFCGYFCGIRMRLLTGLLVLLPMVISHDVILKPVKTGPQEIALVMIQGAYITPDQYTPLAAAIQSASVFTLWIGIPELPFDISEPLALSTGISRVLKSMTEQGMNASTIFYSGHSLGGVSIQDFVYKNSSNCRGLILMGAYLLRKYRNQTYPVSTLTLGGELDGLTRVTRIMEEYYHRILMAKDAQAFPVAVIEGMSHFQFASGNIPSHVKNNDLKPEISYDTAHALVGNLTSAFLALQLGDTRGLPTIQSAVEVTGSFFKPLISAYQLEGFYNFLPPCYDKKPSPDCAVGCSWTEKAQEIMGGLPQGPSLIDKDAFHPVWQVTPIHLPHVTNNCSSPDSSCVLHSVTVTQNVYEDLAKLDVSSTYTSAKEMRAKLKSRQTVMEAAGMKNVLFNVSDAPSICKEINQQAYDWAKTNAGSKTYQRYVTFGEYMTMGEDIGPYNVGPVWIWSSLAFTEAKNSTGGAMLEVQSIMMKTPTDFRIKPSAGMHYCKLLSPARAMEWIYVDSLRKYYSLKA